MFNNAYDDLISDRVANLNGKEYSFKWVTRDTGTWDGPLMNYPSHLELWQKHIRNYDVVIQAGGAMGMHPRFLSEIFGRVYTFEPDPLSFHCLVQNCQSDNIYKINAGLGESTGLCTVHRNCMDNMGMNTVSIQEEDSKVPMFTIDLLCLDKCDFIQLDVEGFETPILLGAEMTITRFKPVIACENGNDVIETLLKPHGYVKVGQSYADSVYAIA